MDYAYNNPVGVSQTKFSSICDTFFELVSEHLLKGGKLTTPLGMLLIIRLRNTRKYVDLGKIRNRENFKNNIFKDSEWTDVFEWNINLAKPYLRKFRFGGCYANNRSIPKFEQVRTLNRESDALQRSLSQGSNRKSG